MENRFKNYEAETGLSIKERFIRALEEVNEEDEKEKEYLDRKLKEFQEGMEEIVRKKEKEIIERN